jgi:flagellar protein FliT
MYSQELEMASTSEVMHYYEQIAPLTERMLVLARNRHWGELPKLEEQQSSMVDRLKEIEPLESLSEAQVARKYQLLVWINGCQAEIYSILMPQLRELGKTLKNLASQQLLMKTYGRTNEPLS